MKKEYINISKLAENTRKFCGIEGNVFSNSLYDFLFQLLFSTLYNIEKNRVESINQFKKEVLSKRDNPKEYLKALINFAQQ